MIVLKTVYNPKETESRWYKVWEDGKYFKPREGLDKSKVYCLVMPPPNITGRLHAGHALDLTTQDALIRFKRMKGFQTLFLPGMDHAGIATQNVVEQLIYKQEKKTRRELGRDQFVKRVWQWKEEYGGVIAHQQRSMGAGPDWDYSLFTMDPQANEAVRKAFVTLYNQKLIYQSDYIVNWDTKLKSAISDAEVEYKEVKGAFYKIKYLIENNDDFMEIATTRPETLLGDTAVCVHPEDDRYQRFIGKKAIVPLCNRVVPIVADEYVDMEKGTGCLKVTPGHDFNDFEIGRRHNLPIINILNEDGTLNRNGGEFQGLSAKEARGRVVEKLKTENLLVSVIPHTHQVGHGERTNSIIEPLVSKQWFLDVQKMSQDAIGAVKDKQTKFFPKSWENTYFSWLKNPRNWCLSRQLWWGHRIPVFYCNRCQHQWADEQTPGSCPECGASEIEQDPDVLDTWFSSSLWPFSTLGWPNEERMKEKKFATFFPSSCLITGYDIIFFWVARMMMMSLKFFDRVPFHHVYIHAIVRDKQGRKMSKSLGNGIDPLDMIDSYGADAFRFTLASGASHNRGLNLDPQKIEGYRNFINKIWNSFRFISSYLDKAESTLPPKKQLSHHEKWILAELNETARVMNLKIEEYRYDEACTSAYSFVYDKFCSWFIELSKETLRTDALEQIQRASVLKYIFRELMALLHPFIPFITEELWSYLKYDHEDLLIVQKYPEYKEELNFVQDRRQMNRFIEAVTGIRGLRAELNLGPKEKIELTIATEDRETLDYFKQHEINFASCAGIKEMTVCLREDFSAPSVSKDSFCATTYSDIYISLKGAVAKKQKKRLEGDLKKSEAEWKKCHKKLVNKGFLSNAPKEVVAEVGERAEELKNKIDSITKALNDLNS